MIALLGHLLIIPVLAPLLVGALQLFLGERRGARIALAIASVLTQTAAALTLLYMTTDAMPDTWTEGVGVYALGSWPAPFGIVLVVDRLSAFMLLFTSLVALASLVYSLAYWDRVAPAFHSLFQFLLMGLNGAFLTGDLFNLFVFFEVLLASSYGLLLHGSGVGRVKASLHYITVNLVASFLFLIGVAMIYGMTGTLNMADLPGRIALLAPHDRALFESGAAILSVAFLIKAGAWPLNFWLPNTYVAASSPIGAVFSLLTKVGVYAVLRVGTVLASGNEQTSFIDVGLFYGDYFARASKRGGGHHHIRGSGHARIAPARSHCELLCHYLHRLVVHGSRPAHRRADRAGDFVSGELCAGDECLLHGEWSGAADTDSSHT